MPVEHLKCSNGKNNPEVISTNDILDDVTNPEQESIAVVDDIENSTQIDENSEKLQPKKSLRSNSKEFKCQECTASFYAKENLNQHIDGYHRRMKPFLCEYCKKAFTIKENLNRHFKLAHQNLKPHKSIDDDANSEKPQAKKSLRSRFLCEYCKKSFTVENNLIRHIKYAHQNLKPHKCIECEKTFSWKQGLHRHVSKAHLKLEPSKPVEVVDVEDLDPFSKDEEDQFKALLSEEKSSENMVILINNLQFSKI